MSERCPIAPGKGCQACEDIDAAVRRAIGYDRRRVVLAVLFVLAVIALSMLAAHIVSAA